MGKREAGNDPDPEPGWGNFKRHRNKRIEDREEIYIPREPAPTDKLENIPPDVPYTDATITCWNGKAFVTWEEWRISVPFRPIVDPKEVSEK